MIAIPNVIQFVSDTEIDQTLDLTLSILVAALPVIGVVLVFRARRSGAKRDE